MGRVVRTRGFRARSLKNIQSAESEQPLRYPELFENLRGIAVQSGLSMEDVESAVVEQLGKLVTKNYLEEHPGAEVDVAVEKNQTKKTLEFYNLAGGKREPLFFTRYRKDTGEFLNRVVANLDAMRAEREYKAYIGKKGTAVECVVQREEFVGYVLDIEPDEFKNDSDGKFRARGFLPKSECINNLVEQRRLKKGEKVMAYITEIKTADVKSNASKRLEDCTPRVMLSRTNNGLLSELLKKYCYEIQDGIVEVKNAVRNPGIHSKVAVFSRNKSIDAVGACLGPYSTRLKPIIAELSDERVQIVQWDEELEKFIENALLPGRIISCVIHPPSLPQDRPFVEVVAAGQDDRRKAVGHNGTNVRLACHLTDTRINILDKVNVQATELSSKRLSLFMEYLGIDEEFAETLMEHGYSSTFAIDYVSPEELCKIPGIDLETANLLIERSRETMGLEVENLCSVYGVESNLIDFLREKKKLYLVYELANTGIKTLSEAHQAYQNTGTSDTDDIALFALRAHLSDIFDNANEETQ